MDSQRARDPVESWELPYADSAENRRILDVRDVYPRTPRRAELVPSDVLVTLSRSCGVESLHQILLIPRAVRSPGAGSPNVISPESVLALGSRAVGLWTETPEPGIKVLIPLEDISAIEDVTILLYGRLSFLSFGKRLTVRYNALARRDLEPGLLELRKRLAGSPRFLPEYENGKEELPYKWKQILEGTLARLHRGASVVFRFASVSGVDEVERSQLLVLNPYELVYMCDPARTPHRCGEDSFIVPRSRGIVARARENSLEIVCSGTHFSLPMASPLCEAAARWFRNP